MHFKQLLNSVFVISGIIKVEEGIISPSRRQRLITLTETLIILDITETESINCFITIMTVTAGQLHAPDYDWWTFFLLYFDLSFFVCFILLFVCKGDILQIIFTNFAIVIQ